MTPTANTDRTTELLQQVDQLIADLCDREVSRLWLGATGLPTFTHYHPTKSFFIVTPTASRIRLPEEHWQLLEQLVLAGLEEYCMKHLRLELSDDELCNHAGRAVWAITVASTRDGDGEVVIGNTSWMNEFQLHLLHAATCAPSAGIEALAATTAVRVQSHPSTQYWLQEGEAGTAITKGLDGLIQAAQDIERNRSRRRDSA